ncbi:regulation of translational initiation [Sparganum proliferum]
MVGQSSTAFTNVTTESASNMIGQFGQPTLVEDQNATAAPVLPSELAHSMANQETQSFEDEVALARCLPELSSLRMTGELTDMAIELQDDVSLHVHRLILVCRVPSLRESLCTMHTQKKTVLQWPKVSSEVARPLIDYVYTGQLEVSEANATGLIVLSQQLVMPRVEEWAHIKTNFEATVASDFFIQLPADTVLSILSADDLIVDREESVFKSIELWVSSPGEVEETRLVHAEAMLREVRWNQVDADFRSRLLNKEGFWSKSMECFKFLARVIAWIAHPSSRVDGECPFNEKRRRSLGGICFISKVENGPRSFIEYDVDANTLKPLVVVTGSSRAVFVAIKGCIFAIGGDEDDGSLPNVHKFDTKELRWKECAPLSTGRMGHSAVVVPVSQKNVIGVFGGWNRQDKCVHTCEVYSPQEDKWYRLPGLRENRKMSAAVALPDGRVFVIGGQCSGNRLSSVEMCHLREPADWRGPRKSSDTFWKAAAPMISTYDTCKAVAFKGSIFISGYNYPNYKYYSLRVDVFVPPDNRRPLGQWTRLTNTTVEEYFVDLAVYQDRLFSFPEESQATAIGESNQHRHRRKTLS